MEMLRRMARGHDRINPPIAQFAMAKVSEERMSWDGVEKER